MPHPTLTAALSGLGSGIPAAAAAGAQTLARETSSTSFAQELQQARTPAAPPPAAPPPPPPTQADKVANRSVERPAERRNERPAERGPERTREGAAEPDSEAGTEATDTRGEAARQRSLRLWQDRWAERSERLGKAERAGAKAALAGITGDDASAQDGSPLTATGRTGSRVAAEAAALDPLAPPLHLTDAVGLPGGKATADTLTLDPSIKAGPGADGGPSRQTVEPSVSDLQAAGDPTLAGTMVGGAAATADLHEHAADALALEGFVATQGAELGTALAPPAAAAPAFASELLRAHAAAGTAAASPGTATEVRLATPVPNPEFVPRFSSELAVLARDGVQEARIQVNPLELGPIAVQITLEGSAAQVHLAVDSAQTRELLEQAMPSLAAALRENGLTLTGGGVFQQTRQQGRDDAGAATGNGQNSGQPGADDAAQTPAAPRRSMHAGAVDVYA